MLNEIKISWTPLPVLFKKGDIVFSNVNPSGYCEILGTGFSVSGFDSEINTENCLKDKMIEYIKQVNSNPDMSKHITKLYYKDENDEWKYVTDYSTFIDYMSEDLQESLKSGRTLTEKLEEELNCYHYEMVYKPEIKQPSLERLVKISKPEVILSNKDTQKLLKIIDDLKSINIL